MAKPQKEARQDQRARKESLTVPYPTRESLRDFPVEDQSISRVRDHLTGVVGGTEGEDCYPSFFLLASLRALTPR